MELATESTKRMQDSAPRTLSGPDYPFNGLSLLVAASWMTEPGAPWMSRPSTPRVILTPRSPSAPVTIQKIKSEVDNSSVSSVSSDNMSTDSPSSPATITKMRMVEEGPRGPPFTVNRSPRARTPSQRAASMVYKDGREVDADDDDEDGTTQEEEETEASPKRRRRKSSPRGQALCADFEHFLIITVFGFPETRFASVDCQDRVATSLGASLPRCLVSIHELHVALNHFLKRFERVGDLMQVLLEDVALAEHEGVRGRRKNKGHDGELSLAQWNEEFTAAFVRRLEGKAASKSGPSAIVDDSTFDVRVVATRLLRKEYHRQYKRCIESVRILNHIKAKQH